MPKLTRLRAAFARSRDVFCVAYGGALDADDPFSALISYDGREAQPWSRVDVQRNIVSIVDHDGDFVALSDEGDVYRLRDPEIVREKIPGAGIYSDDATGKGALAALGIVDGKLAACGFKGQVYARDEAGSWGALGGPIAAEEGFTEIVLVSLVQHGQQVYLCGYANPDNIGMTPEMREALIAQDMERYERLMRALPPARVQEGRAYRRDGAGWTRLAMPNDSVLYTAFVSGTDAVWMLGRDGTIAAASPTGAFTNLGFHGDDEALISGTPFRGQHVLASDFALHVFDGHRLSPLASPLGKATPAPLKVQAVADRLYSFDTKRGIHLYDGENWQEIKIPPQLLARPFTGLPRPK